MNGLSLLGVILGALIGWWAAWALVYGGTRNHYPEDIRRRVDKWDGTR